MWFKCLPQCEILHGEYFFSGYVWVSLFCKSDLGKGGHAEQQTLTFIDVCISVAKHTTQPRHHPHLFRSTGNNIVYFFWFSQCLFFTELHTLQLYFTVLSEEILKERSFLKLINVVSCDRIFFDWFQDFFSDIKHEKLTINLFLILKPKRKGCFLVFLFPDVQHSHNQTSVVVWTTYTRMQCSQMKLFYFPKQIHVLFIPY